MRDLEGKTARQNDSQDSVNVHGKDGVSGSSPEVGSRRSQGESVSTLSPLLFYSAVLRLRADRNVICGFMTCILVVCGKMISDSILSLPSSLY